VSRNGNTFKQFTDLCTRITERYGGHSAVLDGEIVCPDGDGRPVFDVLFRRHDSLCFALSICYTWSAINLRCSAAVGSAREAREGYRCRGLGTPSSHAVRGCGGLA
jgi:hypothetical protein